jgi:hypothetical protein
MKKISTIDVMPKSFKPGTRYASQIASHLLQLKDAIRINSLQIVLYR